MRDWNYHTTDWQNVKPLFPLYLWEIETLDFKENDGRSRIFPLYLWEIETASSSAFFSFGWEFPLYLWEIETIFSYYGFKNQIPISTLPMRDWNKNYLYKSQYFEIYFHSTYERLKQFWYQFKHFIKIEFPLYLWEIETSMKNYKEKNYCYFHSTYERLKRKTGSLPSCLRPHFHSTYERLKQWKKKLKSGKKPKKNFHSTYERLKHFLVRQSFIKWVNFHSTYERLKHFEAVRYLKRKPAHFHSTYERLKQCFFASWMQ